MRLVWTAVLVLWASAGCDVLFGGSHTVKDLDEYEDYIAGADLYMRHGVGVLNFSCDELREQWVNRMQRETDRMVEEENRFVSIYFSNEGSTLTMERASATRVIRAGEFNHWKSEFQAVLAQAADGSSGDRNIDSLVRLFDKVHLRAPDLAADFDVTYGSACKRSLGS